MEETNRLFKMKGGHLELPVAWEIGWCFYILQQGDVLHLENKSSVYIGRDNYKLCD